MKKRRDLDALVNGKLGGRRKKNGQHELLRNTDSSDIEEFAIPPQNLARKHRSTSRFCSTCLAVCGFFLLTACAVAVAGLVWVHIELKKDVELLQIRLSTVENGNAGNDNEFQSVHVSIRKFTDDIQELKTRAESFQKNITSVWVKLNELSSRQPTRTTNPDIEGIRSTVASLGSELETLKATTKHDFEQIQGLLKANDQVTPHTDQVNSGVLTIVKEDIFGVQQNITLLNASITNFKRETALASNQLNASFVKLEDRLSILELKTESTTDPSVIQDTIHDAVHDALSSGTDSDKRQWMSDLENSVNNITLEMDGLKITNRLLNGSIKANQQHLVQLDRMMDRHDTRLTKLESSNSQADAPNLTPSDAEGKPSPQPSSPDASSEKKSDSPLFSSSKFTEAPPAKPTSIPIEEGQGVPSPVNADNNLSTPAISKESDS